MAITFGAASTIVISGQNPASITPTMPTGIVAKELLVLFVAVRTETATVATPTDWTLLGSVAGGGGTFGASAGPSRIYAFSRIATATAADTLGAITLTGANMAFTQVFRYTNATGFWLTAVASGSDSTVGTAWSVTCDVNPGLTAGDHVVVGTANGQAGTTWSAQAVSATGVTAWSAFTEVNEINSTTGSDINGMTFRGSVTTGTSTAAPVITATAAGTTTNTRGVSLLVRMREDTATPPAAPTLTLGAVNYDAVALSWTAPANANTYDIERNGVVAVTGLATTTYNDTGRSPSTLYSYRVRGVGAAGAGAWSNTVSGTTTTPPPLVIRSTGVELAPAGTQYPTTGVMGDGDAVQAGSNISGIPTSQTGDAPQGTYFARFVIGNTTTGAQWRRWNTGTDYYLQSTFRFYFRISALPSASMAIMSFYDVNTTIGPRVRVESTGKMTLFTPGQSQVATTGTLPVDNVWRRCEGHFNISTGDYSMDLYDGHSTTPAAGFSLAGTWASVGVPNIAMMGWGITTPTTVLNFTLDIDAPAWRTDLTRIGPAGAAAAPYNKAQFMPFFG